MPYKYEVSLSIQAPAPALLAGTSFCGMRQKPTDRAVVIASLPAGVCSVPDAIGRHYKMQNGTRVQVVGVVEDGDVYEYY